MILLAGTFSPRHYEWEDQCTWIEVNTVLRDGGGFTQVIIWGWDKHYRKDVVWDYVILRGEADTFGYDYRKRKHFWRHSGEGPDGMHYIATMYADSLSFTETANDRELEDSIVNPRELRRGMFPAQSRERGYYFVRSTLGSL